MSAIDDDKRFLDHITKYPTTINNPLTSTLAELAPVPMDSDELAAMDELMEKKYPGSCSQPVTTGQGPSTSTDPAKDNASGLATWNWASLSTDTSSETPALATYSLTATTGSQAPALSSAQLASAAISLIDTIDSADPKDIRQAETDMRSSKVLAEDFDRFIKALYATPGLEEKWKGICKEQDDIPWYLR